MGISITFKNWIGKHEGDTENFLKMLISIELLLLSNTTLQTLHLILKAHKKVYKIGVIITSICQTRKPTHRDKSCSILLGHNVS